MFANGSKKIASTYLQHYALYNFRVINEVLFIALLLIHVRTKKQKKMAIKRFNAGENDFNNLKAKHQSLKIARMDHHA